ncbi:MAG: hypothetical protein ACE5HO_14205 [bacterium]
MKKIAAIDIGTNTALLLVAEIDARGHLKPVLQKETIVRLGQGVDQRGRLQPEAMSRTLQALREYRLLARELNAEQILAAGTSAVRDAKNRNDFVSRIKNELNLELQILTGKQEARLTHLGALSNKSYLKGGVVVIDIGGGSTEFIFGDRDQIEFAQSLDLGSVRLTERFVRHDPISEEEFGRIRESVAEGLEKLHRSACSNKRHLVGVAGTVTTLAAIQAKMANYQPEVIDGDRLSLDQIRAIVDELKIKTLAERKKIVGLHPKRADVILAGAVILLESAGGLGFQEVTVSDRGIRFGLILDYLTRGGVA